MGPAPGPPHGQGGARAGRARRRAAAPPASRWRARLGATRSRVVGRGGGRRSPGRCRRCSTRWASRVAEGYRRVKLKIQPGLGRRAGRWRCAAAFPDLALQVDANGSYRLADADRLAAPGRGPPAVPGAAARRRRPGRPRRLGGENGDAAVPGRVDHLGRAAAETALALGACRVINIKAGRVGGYLEAVRIHDSVRTARRAGVVRRHAGDRRGPDRQPGPGRAAEFFPPRRPVGLRPFLPATTSPSPWCSAPTGPSPCPTAREPAPCSGLMFSTAPPSRVGGSAQGDGRCAASTAGGRASGERSLDPGGDGRLHHAGQIEHDGVVVDPPALEGSARPRPGPPSAATRPPPAPDSASSYSARLMVMGSSGLGSGS